MYHNQPIATAKATIQAPASFNHPQPFHPTMSYNLNNVSDYPTPFISNSMMMSVPPMYSSWSPYLMMPPPPPHYSSNPWIASQMMSPQHYPAVVPPHSTNSVHFHTGPSNGGPPLQLPKEADITLPKRMDTKITSKPSTTKPKKDSTLSHNPMKSPSPYLKTHENIVTEIFLWKRNDATASFGVTLRLDMTSVLVDPNMVTTSAVSSTPPSLSTTKSIVPSDTITAATPTNPTAVDTSITTDTLTLFNEPPVQSTAGVDSITIVSLTTDETAKGLQPSDTELSTSNPTAKDITSSIASKLSTNPNQLLKPTRNRRRRVFYHVLRVEYVKENIRNVAAPEGFCEKELLHPGDLILSIDGTVVDGLTFTQACLLFKKCATTTSDGQYIQCRLLVARYKPPVIKTSHVPLKMEIPVAAQSHDTMKKTMLKRSPNDLHELYNLSLSLLHAFADTDRRMLGSPVSINAVIDSIVTTDPKTYAVNSPTDIMYMIDLWNRTSSNWDKAMKKNSQAYWTQQWSNESKQFILPSNFKYLTDAQRHTMRRRKQGLQVPRTRCRCLSYDHFYVNDEHCPLYSNLRALYNADNMADPNTTDPDQTSVLKHPSNEKDIVNRSRAMAKTLSRDLNTMEKACCDRLARTLTENENALAEQQFIEGMEEVQRTKTKQSLSAPSLTAIVLSVIAQLECECGEKMAKMQLPVIKPTPKVDVLDKTSRIDNAEMVEGKNELVNEEEDDDVPLMALCKRRNEDCPDPSLSKKQKCDPTNYSLIHPWYLAKLVHFISTRWGHVYQEPSNEDYVW
jgi:hypothetical protein